MLLNNAVEIINSARLELGELALQITRNQQEGNNYTDEQKRLQSRLLWTYAILNIIDPVITIEDDEITQILDDYDNAKLNRILLALRAVSGAGRKPILSGILNPIGSRLPGGEAGGAGADGDNAYLYVGYADDSIGTGYSSSPTGKTYIAFKQSNVALTPTAATFAGAWVQFVGGSGSAGAAGDDGTSQYLFQAWADDTSGTGFTLTFSASKKYTAFLVKDNDTAPVQADYTGLWTKYKGDDGAAGSAGTNGKTVLNGVGSPAAGLGANGDFYIDTSDANKPLYGPKTLGAWGAATNLKGDTGDDGAAGATGAAGADGSDAFVYVAYADSSDGTGFTLTFDPSKNYIAVRQASAEILSPVIGDFAGLWTKFRGEGGDRYSTTSSTSLTIATGVQHLIVDQDLAYSTGQRALIALNNDPTNKMEGTVVSYDAPTGQIVVDVDTIAGSGTYAVWDVNLNGAAVGVASQKAFYATLGTDQGSGGASQALSTTPAVVDAFDAVVAQSAGMTADATDNDITVDNNGSYVLDFNATVSGTASSDITFQFYKNGVAIANALARVLFDGSGNPQNVVIHLVQEDVQQSDVFDVRAVASAATPSILVQQGRFSMYTIGFINSEQYKDFENLDIDTGTEVVDNFLASLGSAVEFKYTVIKGAAFRAGSIIAVWDGTNPPEHSEIGTISIGDTSDLVLDVDFSGGDIRLKGTAASDNWIVKGKRTIIG